MHMKQKCIKHLLSCTHILYFVGTLKSLKAFQVFKKDDYDCSYKLRLKLKLNLNLKFDLTKICETHISYISMQNVEILLKVICMQVWSVMEMKLEDFSQMFSVLSFVPLCTL